MTQIAVTLEQIQHNDDRRHTLPTPTSTTIGLALYIFSEAKTQEYHIKRWLNKADK